MPLEILSKLLVEKLLNLSLNQRIELFETLLVNERAFSFAKERLRSQYEKKLIPASYEHVSRNLLLTKQDFIEYFKTITNPTNQNLAEHLKNQLRKRSLDWTYNRPSEDLFNQLVDDFYEAYESYFITADSKLSTLHVIGLSNEVKTILSEINDKLNFLSRELQKTEDFSGAFLDNIATFLTVLNIPFEILEKSKDHIDIIIRDVSSMLPTTFYVSAVCITPDFRIIDNLAERSKSQGKIAHILLVSNEKQFSEYLEYGERRGITLLTIEKFKETFSRVSSSEKFVTGVLASQSLLKAFNIHEIFIQPDAVPAEPDERMEDKFLDVRLSAAELVDKFLGDEEEKILFVLGGYGSGKSALCAYLNEKYCSKDDEFISVYFSLKQLRSADDLSKIVTKSDQLAKTISKGKKKTVLILDGLDELPNAMDLSERRFNMLRLLQSAPRTDKIIISVRTSYFRGLEDFWNLFARPKDHSLWDKLAKYITETGNRPKVSAIILREFDNRQIDLYVKEYAHVRKLNEDFPSRFFDRMRKNDPKGTYRLLARNPLYLFLLVDSEPWSDPNVSSFADVLKIFVLYWLERDIEKGPSRWLLTIRDRMEFILAVSWWMFQNNRISISFKEFDDFVNKFYGESVYSPDLTSISLDLQTTGVFACIGGLMYFSLPAFMDYFIALRFYDGFLKADEPNKLPSIDQARILLGMIETNPIGKTSWWYEDSHRTNENVKGLLRDLGIQRNKNSIDKSEISPIGIMYGNLDTGWNWTNANQFVNSPIRMLVKRSLAPRESENEQIVLVRLTNLYGLHARPSAIICKAYQKWMLEFPEEKKPIVFFRYEGLYAHPANIMELMTLCVEAGRTFEIVYKSCSEGEIEGFLEKIGGERSAGPEGFIGWVANIEATN